MLPLVFSTIVISGAPAPAGLRQQLPPTWVARSVSYPRRRPAPIREPGPRATRSDIPRSVRYPRRAVRRATAARRKIAARGGGSYSVVIRPLATRLRASRPRIGPPRPGPRTVARTPARRRAVLEMRAKAPVPRPAALASRLPHAWLPARRRKVIHHQRHRLPPPARPTPAWEPGEDQRPLVGPTRAISSAACLARLRQLRVPFRGARPRRGLVTPVVITGPVNGLKLTPMWGGRSRRPALMDCRFALLLHRIAPIMRRVGVDELLYSGFYSYRYVTGSRLLSRHGNGLAVDVFAVRGPGGFSASVLKDWVKAKGRPGDCAAGVTQPKARTLRRLACALEYSGLLYTILTPDSDYTHRNHFHIAALRPGERPPTRRFAGRFVRGHRRARHRVRHQARRGR